MAYDFNPLKAKIKEGEEHLTRELGSVRTGRASPSLLDGVRAEVYGAKSPLIELANISTEDPRTLRVIPWDKSLTRDIEKAVVAANLGVGVAVDDVGLRVTFPELTSERRQQLTKLANERLEEARVALRSHRTEAIKEIEALVKDGMGEDVGKRNKEELQKLIDAANAALEALAKKKEQEIAA
ncbi:MAG: ribosome recycling factor [Minisyncoccia bacterium]